MSGSDDNSIQLWDAQTGGLVGTPLQGHMDSVNSVVFSSDGRHIVSGSDDNSIRLWNAHTGGQVGNPLQGHMDLVNSVVFGQATTFNSITLSPICFSSSAAHALKDAQSLFIDMFDVKGDSRDLVSLQNDGWIVGPSEQLLLWIPYSYHPFFFYTPWTNMVIPRGCPELDLSRMAHGPAWHKCYMSGPQAT